MRGSLALLLLGSCSFVVVHPVPANSKPGPVSCTRTNGPPALDLVAALSAVVPTAVFTAVSVRQSEEDEKLLGSYQGLAIASGAVVVGFVVSAIYGFRAVDRCQHHPMSPPGSVGLGGRCVVDQECSSGLACIGDVCREEVRVDPGAHSVPSDEW
jgi:hypothetical protein